jgi:hypothetical protein
MSTRAIPLSAHATIEILAAPLLMAAPFLFGFGQTAGAISIAMGTLLMGLAISTATEARTIPISAHAGFDYVIGMVTLISGLALGLTTGEAVATAFLVGFGAAHLALTALTRYSARGV